MYLQHLHLPSLTRYQLVSVLQDLLVRQKISHHHPSSAFSLTPILTGFGPSPFLLTFTSPPTYTSGRRQTLSPSQIQRLEQSSTKDGTEKAAYIHSPRGGLLTFHGPGQLTAYPIVHLRSHKLTVRSYIALLEAAIIRVLKRYAVHGFTRPEYPGVWVDSTQKLASIGVHVQRGVTCFGTALNVTTDRKWWDRFTACGIEGVKMVGLADLGVAGLYEEGRVEMAGNFLAEELATVMDNLEGVERVDETLGKSLLEMAKDAEKLVSLARDKT